MMALWAPGLGGDLVITDPTRSRLLRFSARHTPAHREFSNTLSQIFTTFSYETDEPLSLDGLREAARKLPVGVYRCKGVVHSTEEPDRRIILQVVGKRVDIVAGDEWNGREARTRIVAIGKHDEVDEAALRAIFDRCRSLPKEPAITGR